MDDSLHEDSSDVNNQTGSSNKDRRAPDNAEPLTVTIEAATKNKYSYEAKQYRLDRTRYRLEKKAYCVAKWTMVFLIVYTCLTLFVAIASIIAAGAAQESTRQAREQFLSSIRPRVWLTPNTLKGPEFANTRPKTGQILWTYHYTTSNGTAYNVTTAERSMKLGEDGEWRRSYGLPSGKEAQISIPLVVGQDSFNTVVSEPGITPEQFKEWSDTDHAMSIRVIIEYEDAVGTHYETSVCLTNLRLGAIQYCDGSYIK